MTWKKLQTSYYRRFAGVSYLGKALDDPKL